MRPGHLMLCVVAAAVLFGSTAAHAREYEDRIRPVHTERIERVEKQSREHETKIERTRRETLEKRQSNPCSGWNGCGYFYR